MGTPWFKLCCASALMLGAMAACGDDETTAATPTTTAASSSSGSGGSGTTTSTAATGGGGSTSSSSTGGGGAGGMMSGPSYSVTFANDGQYPYFCKIHANTMTGVVYVGTQTGAGGAGGNGGAAPGTVHGCTFDTAADMTTMTTVTLAWTNPHDQCVKVANGTTVTWQGNFTPHPIIGGVSPTADTGSPIDCDTSGGDTSCLD
jgi:plastocyanin